MFLREREMFVFNAMCVQLVVKGKLLLYLP